LPGDSQVHFSFAVNEVSELEHTIKCSMSYLSQSLPIRERRICVTCTQGFLVTQTQQFHLHTLVGLKFSSFSPTNFTDHHFAYYLALEKNKGALETEDEPFTAFLNIIKFLISSIGCCRETRIRQNFKSIRHFAISPLWPLGI